MYLFGRGREYVYTILLHIADTAALVVCGIAQSYIDEHTCRDNVLVQHQYITPSP